MRKKTCCVIGCGVSGLVAMKELLQEGHEVECYDTASDLGGAFSGPGHESNRAYDSLLLTISNYYMAFSDFPPKDDWQFWDGRQYLDYLKDYAGHFDLLKKVKFSTEVVRVTRADDGKWAVAVKVVGGTDEVVKEYDALAVCNGTHQKAKIPDIKGIDTFKGDIDHAATFLRAPKYEGKRVVVVGMGESAADIVRDISDVSSQCHLVMKSNPLCLPRLLPDGAPADSLTSHLFYQNRDDSFFKWLLCLLYITFLWLPMVALGLGQSMWRFSRKTDAMGQEKSKFMDKKTVRTAEMVNVMAKWHYDGNNSFCNKFAVKNVSWIPNVVDGKIEPHISTIKEVANNTIILENGTSFEVDAIMFCTGYKDEFPFLPRDVAPKDDDVRDLFLHAFNPSVGPSVSFIGFSRPTTGAIPACSELIARYFALLVSGKRALPKGVEKMILDDKQREEKWICKSVDVRSVVSPTDYMDTVAKLVGCHRSAWTMWYQPLNYIKWLVGLNCPAKYRMVGPHSCPEAATKWWSKVLIELPPPALVMIGTHKLLYSLGYGTGDFMVDMRKKFDIEVTKALAYA